MAQKHFKDRFTFDIRWGGLQREILGLLLLTLGCITLLALFSVTRGALSDRWAGLLSQSFGWGAYLVPGGLAFTGLFLLRRNLAGPEQVRWETIVGLEILAVLSLAVMHFWAMLETPLEMAPPGEGGGLVGWAISTLLLEGLGPLLTPLFLLAGLALGLMLTFSLTPGQLWAAVKSCGTALVAFYRWGLALVQAPLWPEKAPPPPTGEKEASPPPPAPAKLRINRPRKERTSRPAASHRKGRLPLLDLLDKASPQVFSEQEARRRAQLIEETLESFGVPAKVVEINIGPTVTQFGVEPGYIERRSQNGQKRWVRVRVRKINALVNDLALALAAAPIRIEAPVPGRPVVGIEVPNSEVALVSLREVIESTPFRRLKSKLKIALGRDVSGQPVVADLTTMPHLLIAGATGSGKSVCINSIVACLLCNNTPDDLRLIMVDPKRVELTNFNGIPHLMFPVVVDLERVVGTLRLVTREMDQRYRRFASVGARNIEDYNQRMAAEGEHMPCIVVVIDELADLMMLAPDEVERAVCRIAQMSRATGIHLIIATQRPSVDVVTGLIKANFPARISFAVTSQVDSRVILDMGGAERLLGRGDMLYMASDRASPMRLQGCFVSDRELNRLVRYWKGARTAEVPDLESARPEDFVQRPLWEEMRQKAAQAHPEDDLLGRAIEVVRQANRASISLLQRKLRIGYSRAARLIDLLEEKGYVGPPQGGSRAREVLLPPEDEA